MAKDDGFRSFRIGDRARPHIRSGTPLEEVLPTAWEPPGGFSNIERLLEMSSAEAVADTLRVSYRKLEALTASPDMRTRTAAKKAMVAYERVADLIEFLFATRTTLQNEDL